MAAETADENWFHPLEKLSSREDAEEKLRERGFREGLFLVRESSTSEGDFVLSVVHREEVIHYQIRRFNEDAFFSLAEGTKVIHGLDELVFHYRNHENSGLQHRLVDFVECEPCPPGVRLHGRENLLHRAAAAGDPNVVSELLGCGYRNLAAKNHDGQTAVHLAAYFGRHQVLRVLAAGASAGKQRVSLNSVDSSGYSPLHFAAQAGQASAIRILLGLDREAAEVDGDQQDGSSVSSNSDGHRAKANPIARNQITGWLPLHESAWKGFENCCLALIEGGSPIRPRTPKNETPADLARANGLPALADKLESLQEEPLSAEEADMADWWGSVTVSRDEALHAITAAGTGDGTFLVRGSRKGKNVFVLSLLYESKTHHFEIVRQGVFYFLEEGPYLPSLGHLVRHYTHHSDGLPCRLKHPVSCTAATQQRPAPAPRVTRREKMVPYPSNLKNIDKRLPYENNDSLRRVRHSRDAIPLESVSIGAMIGEGEFGSVWEGEYLDADGNRRKVAVKRLNALEGRDAVAKQQREEFAKEAQLMMMLDHQCVVQFIGITTGSLVMMVLELVPLGSLLSYLQDYPHTIRPNQEIPLWISCGMSYLASQRFIHRDLAARNILLASKFQVKISDFGLSRHVEEKDYYRATRGGRWPIKWYAPECVNYGTFSSRSDVWSFGVLLWEMFTYGKQPYDDMTGIETVRFIEEGKRLPRPDRAELEMYSTMLWCWEYRPEDRPSFQELFKIFVENPEYENMKELLKIQDLSQLGIR